MRTFSEVANDPTSNLAKKLATVHEQMRQDREYRATLIAQGYTPEQAMARFLREVQP